MPFLWTAIHLIDVISAAAGVSDSSNQADKEQSLNRENSLRRVRHHASYGLASLLFISSYLRAVKAIVYITV